MHMQLDGEVPHTTHTTHSRCSRELTSCGCTVRRGCSRPPLRIPPQCRSTSVRQLACSRQPNHSTASNTHTATSSFCHASVVTSVSVWPYMHALTNDENLHVVHISAHAAAAVRAHAAAALSHGLARRNRTTGRGGARNPPTSVSPATSGTKRCLAHGLPGGLFPPRRQRQPLPERWKMT